MLFLSHKRDKTLLAGLLSLILVFSISFALFETPAVAVNRSELNSLKQQQEQLAEKKSGIQAQANELSSKVASQTEKLDLLTEQLNITNSEIENLSEQIAIYTNSIARMENELNVCRQKEQELLEHYKIRMRAMEENGKYAYISILLGANSFKDLLSRIDDVKQIMEYDNGLIKDVQEAQVKVQNAKADMEAEMAEQQKTFEAYQEKQADLIAQQDEAKAILASLSADSADYENQLESVKALQSTLNSQISDMESRLAEQERIQKEQNAANQTGGGNTGNNTGSNGGNSNWYGDSAGTASGQDIVNFAQSFLGVNYVYGGTSPSGFDCSGLVYYCYTHYGYSVNRTAAGLAYNGTSVSSSSLQPGDIILFTSQGGSYIGHTGLYVGGGQFIHAPHTGDVVKFSSLSESYYANHYWGARRVVS
jgi:cell wall-associated NlpC family hydrolase